MKSPKKLILIVLLLIFIVIQFFRPEKNNGELVTERHISKAFAVSDDINKILNKACNDCHSNKTDYPWYSHVQPVAWWLAGHINDGKRHLNFSEFTGYSLKKQYHKLEEIIEMVKSEEMPLQSYTLIHTSSKLTEAEKSQIITWAENAMQEMKTKYPPDSLVARN